MYKLRIGEWRIICILGHLRRNYRKRQHHRQKHICRYERWVVTIQLPLKKHIWHLLVSPFVQCIDEWIATDPAFWTLAAGAWGSSSLRISIRRKSQHRSLSNHLPNAPFGQCVTCATRRSASEYVSSPNPFPSIGGSALLLAGVAAPHHYATHLPCWLNQNMCHPRVSVTVSCHFSYVSSVALERPSTVVIRAHYCVLQCLCRSAGMINVEMLLVCLDIASWYNDRPTWAHGTTQVASRWQRLYSLPEK